MAEKLDNATAYMANVALREGRDWISPTEIGIALSDGTRHSSYGSPICKKGVQLGLLERNDKGHYKLITEKEARENEEVK